MPFPQRLNPLTWTSVLLSCLLGLGLLGCRTKGGPDSKGAPPAQAPLKWVGRARIVPANLEGMAGTPAGALKVGERASASQAPPPEARKEATEEFLLDQGRRILIAKGEAWTVPEGFPGAGRSLDLWASASGPGPTWLGEGQSRWRMDLAAPLVPRQSFSASSGSREAGGVGVKLTAEGARTALKGMGIPEGRLEGSHAKFVAEWLKDGAEGLHQAIRVPFGDGSSWWFLDAGILFGRFGSSIVLRTTAQGEATEGWIHEWAYEGRSDNTWWIQPEGAFAVVGEEVLVLDFQRRSLVRMPGYGPFHKNPSADGDPLNLTYDPGTPVRAGNLVISALAPDRFHAFRLPSGGDPPAFLKLFRVPPRLRHASGTPIVSVQGRWVMWRGEGGEWVAWDPEEDSMHLWAKGAAPTKG